MVSVVYRLSELSLPVNSVIIPFYTSNKSHPCESNVLLFYVRTFETTQTHDYIIPINTMDCKNFDLSDVLDWLMIHQLVYVYDTKSFIESTGYAIQNIIDIKFLVWTTQNRNLEIAPTLDRALFRLLTYDKFVSDSLKVVPTTKIADAILNALDECDSVVRQSFTTNPLQYKSLHDDMIASFIPVECVGVFKNGKRQYTQYHLYHITGRPSNTFGGVNYAAIEKTESARQSYQSRFKSGKLIQFDYDAFHVSLIAKLIEYEFPIGENPHMHLAKMYFQKDDISDEEYSQAKTRTFRNLYGGIPSELMQHEFYAGLSNLIDNLWQTFMDDGVVYSFVYSRPFFLDSLMNSKLNPMVLFNYLLQSFETEYNISKLIEINRLLESFSAKLILYTYDSFLIDSPDTEIEPVVESITKILQSEGITVKVSVGETMWDL